MKQRLGPKKIRKIEEITGKKVEAAYVRGGWPHGYAEVFFENEEYSLDSPPPFICYRPPKDVTGGIKPHPFAKHMKAIKKVIKDERS